MNTYDKNIRASSHECWQHLRHGQNSQQGMTGCFIKRLDKISSGLDIPKEMQR